MRSVILSFVLAVGFLTFTSFSKLDNEYFVGTYGISPTNNSLIKLSIHSDFTFTYQDLTNPKNVIDVQGMWIKKGNRIVLKSSGLNDKFHNVWKFHNNGLVAKSRKGFTFYRLCKI